MDDEWYTYWSQLLCEDAISRERNATKKEKGQRIGKSLLSQIRAINKNRQSNCVMCRGILVITESEKRKVRVRGIAAITENGDCSCCSL